MTGAYNCFIYPHFFYNFNQLWNYAAISPPPPSLRGPPPLTPSCVPPLPPPLVTPAHARLDALGSGHQQWCWNLTAGHHMPVSPLPP